MAKFVSLSQGVRPSTNAPVAGLTRKYVTASALPKLGLLGLHTVARKAIVRNSSISQGLADTEGDRMRKRKLVSGPCQRLAASMTASVQQGPQNVRGVSGQPTCRFRVASLSGQIANTPSLLSRTKAVLCEQTTRTLASPASKRTKKVSM